MAHDLGNVLQDVCDSTQLHPPKKHQMICYDRERAAKSVQSDWCGPCPRFDDHQFKRTFRIKQNMVEIILGNLANFDPFWTQSIDCCGRISIDPIVKFLAAMKMVCYGVLFSAFADYYQMGESTAKLCFSKLCQGIVKCPAISNYYL